MYIAYGLKGYDVHLERQDILYLYCNQKRRLPFKTLKGDTILWTKVISSKSQEGFQEGSLWVP